LTLAESRYHFALWAAMKSPLIIGTALENITADNLAIISNTYLLSFNQDRNIGRSAYPYKWGFNPDWSFDPLHPAEYWSGPTSNEGVLILMMNTEDTNATRTAVWSEVPELQDIEKRMKIRRGGKGGGGFNVVDVWTGKEMGCVRDSYSVELETHDAAVSMVKQPLSHYSTSS
ncbi:hypothetical protein OIDMADRAFT_135764, partial [Oidiodendron maius Zn]